MAISFCSYLIGNIVIAPKFCTCHGSYAVMACAKLCSDLTIRNWNIKCLNSVNFEFWVTIHQWNGCPGCTYLWWLWLYHMYASYGKSQQLQQATLWNRAVWGNKCTSQYKQCSHTGMLCMWALMRPPEKLTCIPNCHNSLLKLAGRLTPCVACLMKLTRGSKAHTLKYVIILALVDSLRPA